MNKNIIHLLIVCMSYAYFGFGLAVQQFGIKAGLSLEATIIIFSTSVICLMISVFTSMEKIKKKLNDE